MAESTEPKLIKKKKKKSNKMGFITQKRKPGRPKEFFWENHKSQMLEGFKQGYSLKEIACSLNICYEHFIRLIAKDEQLSQFIQLGQSISESWWTVKGRSNLENRSFNSQLYSLMMMNLHGWGIKNRTEVKVKEVPQSILTGVSDALIDSLLENE